MIQPKRPRPKPTLFGFVTVIVTAGWLGTIVATFFIPGYSPPETVAGVMTAVTAALATKAVTDNRNKGPKDDDKNSSNSGGGTP